MAYSVISAVHFECNIRVNNFNIRVGVQLSICRINKSSTVAPIKALVVVAYSIARYTVSKSDSVFECLFSTGLSWPLSACIISPNDSATFGLGLTPVMFLH